MKSSHDTFDWTKLILDNWKVIAAVLVFFGAGGLGYGTHSYLNTDESKAEPIVKVAPAKPCIISVKAHNELHRD